MGPQLRAVWEGSPALFMPEGRWDLPPRTVVEIGSGMGDSLIGAASRWELAIGIDVHVRGLAATVRAARAGGIDNVRVVQADAVEVLRDRVPPASLDEIHVWFPDPWPKSRHHKRRLIRSDAAGLIASRLRDGGALRLATDVPQYARAMQTVLGGLDELQPQGRAGVVERPQWRPISRYERAGLAAGRTVTELAYSRR